MTNKPEPKYKFQRMDGTWSREYFLSEPFPKNENIQAMMLTEMLTREEIKLKYPEIYEKLK